MVALVIIYNHKYEKNILILEDIYGERFSHIFHLMPFYMGKCKNVISVYENSYYFQGYIAQAYQILKDKGEFKHFFFIGDDLLLNPEVNESNYKEYLSLQDKDSFFSRFDEVSRQGKWPHLKKIMDFSVLQAGLEIHNELPKEQDVLECFKRNGLQTPFIRIEDIYAYPKKEHYSKGIKGLYWYNKDKRKAKKILSEEKILLKYPLVCGYSDILVVSSQDMEHFANYCGIFSAAKLFVEAAIPTAMIISCKSIKTEKDIHIGGLILWEDRVQFEEKYNKSLNELFLNFPKDILYVHPVKLSKWKKTN